MAEDTAEGLQGAIRVDQEQLRGHIDKVVRVSLASAEIERMTLAQDLAVAPVMPLRRTHVADAAVTMLVVVPVHESTRPCSCGLEVGKADGRELRAVLRGAKQALDEGVVVAHPGAASTRA
jgi:hypothetical protein